MTPFSFARIVRGAQRCLAWPLAAAAMLVLGSCGGGSGSGGEPPTATLTAPAPLADGLAGTLALTATASGISGVAAVEFQVDGVTVGSEDSTAPYSVSIDTQRWASGQHVVRARARDTAGRVSPWAAALVRFGGNRQVPAGFSKNDAWVGGLNNATAFAQAPDGRLFVAEQGGALRVVKNGTLLATPFITRNVDAQGERGLIGVTLHPNFAANGWVYIYYTRPNGASQNNRISRFTANGDIATGAETVIVDLPNTQATNHNGGALKFGVDGKLYVGVGDDGRPTEVPQASSVFGKLLRFNDDGGIPDDNPFIGGPTGLARAVWARGLRNPYTFAIEPGSGRMLINDVGQETWEEINLGLPGANYGWPSSEGPDNLSAGITAPAFAYGHNAATPQGSGPGGFLRGAAITGGAFYPANGAFPAGYRGNYFFADFSYGWVAQLDLGNGNAAYAFASVAGNPLDLLAGTGGELFVLTRNAITRITSP